MQQVLVMQFRGLSETFFVQKRPIGTSQIADERPFSLDFQRAVAITHHGGRGPELALGIAADQERRTRNFNCFAI
jgi:hypothetical protein